MLCWETPSSHFEIPYPEALGLGPLNTPQIAPLRCETSTGATLRHSLVLAHIAMSICRMLMEHNDMPVLLSPEPSYIGRSQSSARRFDNSFRNVAGVKASVSQELFLHTGHLHSCYRNKVFHWLLL
ncbi:hypothetical protein JZ751_028903 [Albula glossodonta]|uniref:Uncharacterized protein n=1 Tax=Albula glossodonta TaxID=121402 RepID=A0A8T2NAI8_9TELE|nr:hypothetical protein JZ751_028903 [Albula glossodonta]